MIFSYSSRDFPGLSLVSFWLLVSCTLAITHETLARWSRWGCVQLQRSSSGLDKDKHRTATLAPAPPLSLFTLLPSCCGSAPRSTPRNLPCCCWVGADEVGLCSTDSRKRQAPCSAFPTLMCFHRPAWGGEFCCPWAPHAVARVRTGGGRDRFAHTQRRPCEDRAERSREGRAAASRGVRRCWKLKRKGTDAPLCPPERAWSCPHRDVGPGALIVDFRLSEPRESKLYFGALSLVLGLWRFVTVAIES